MKLKDKMFWYALQAILCGFTGLNLCFKAGFSHEDEALRKLREIYDISRSDFEEWMKYFKRNKLITPDWFRDEVDETPDLYYILLNRLEQ